MIRKLCKRCESELEELKGTRLMRCPICQETSSDFLEIEKDYVIMDITCGDLVGRVYETHEEAEDWINAQVEEFRYEIIERD